MSTATMWACAVCGEVYDSQHAADACEAVPLQKPMVAVGDIVTCRAGFGWYDGKRSWVSNAKRVDPKRRGKPGPMVRKKKCPNGDGNCFRKCCTFQFYYVVTHIDYTGQGDHQARYHLVTEAMTGANGNRIGWTTYPGHFKPVRVAKPPQSVLRSSKSLVGTKAEHLL